MKVSRVNHLLLVDSRLSCDMFNVLCCNGAADPSFIYESIAYFRAKQLPYAFWVGFEDEPPWLEAELLRLGLITDEIEWAMTCDLNKVQEQIHHSHIKKICDREGIQDLVQVMKAIFPKKGHNAIESFYQESAACLLLAESRLTFFIGYESGKPVSLVSVYLDEEMASIFDVIVLPEMRGKGFGKLMTQKGMLEAKVKGFDRCILTATNDAKYLYQKLGFVEVKTMKVYHEES